MTVKIVTLVLALLLLVGMLARSRVGGLGKAKPKGPAIEAARKCRACGAYALARSPCARPDCPQR